MGGVELRSAAPAADAIAALEMPRVVRLRHNLYAACFAVMKILPARAIVDAALRDGRIGPRTTVVESTSGSFGLGLAMVTALRRVPLVLVSDPVIDDALRRRLVELGARVEIVEQPAPAGGYQQARLDRLAELTGDLDPVFVPDQYDNPANPQAYRTVAELLHDAVGPVNTLVGCVGSGGSLCGTAAGLRADGSAARTVAVDTHGSVLFGLPDASRPLRGLGNSLHPRNLDHAALDEVHWVGAAEAFRATRRLHHEHALFMGPTSGAAHLVADWTARREPDRTVVVLLPDEGHRYQSTSGDPEWLHRNGLYVDDVPWDPVEHVLAPGSGPDASSLGGRWDHAAWRRRILSGPGSPTREAS